MFDVAADVDRDNGAEITLDELRCDRSVSSSKGDIAVSEASLEQFVLLDGKGDG